ncbi:hypothetical protein JDV02_000780 [Purpureocillium takamizusanense]|uniref:Uncharacterized protein n=1 Tax=Purpureocillium takamizusanense TaxID=2060973 RepID=A0A9Q8Q7C2_9HYPO|nr:uncharacterized protein JDV02_000780 [Purpureocillium takamizusanense]UNI14112.1 hypothetical protein JDV02_000780 [Purpureocillium takamizusanense]
MAPAVQARGGATAAHDMVDELLLSTTPTPTLPVSATDDDSHYQLLRARQSAPTATVTVVSGGDSGDNGGGSATTLSGGAIAGIVIGSIAGFLLLVWIYRSCFNIGAPPGEDREAWYHDVDPKRSSHHHHHHGYHHSRPRHSSHHHRHHSRRRSSLSSTMSTPPPVVVRETSRTQPVYVARGRDRVSRSRGRQY